MTQSLVFVQEKKLKCYQGFPWAVHSWIRGILISALSLFNLEIVNKIYVIFPPFTSFLLKYSYSHTYEDLKKIRKYKAQKIKLNNF